MLRIKVKVGNITHLSDARYCAGMGADLLGFPVSDSDGLSAERFKEITNWISGPQLVLEWSGDNAPADATSLLAGYNAEMLQVSVQHLAEIDKHVKLLVVVSSGQLSHADKLLEGRKEQIAFVIVDRDILDEGPEWIKRFPILLASHENQASLDTIDQLQLAGICLEGSAEARPGVTDYSSLADIFEKLEVD